MNIVEVTYRWAKPLYRRSATDYIIIHHEAGNGQTPQSIHQQHIAQGNTDTVGKADILTIAKGYRSLWATILRR